MAKKTNKGPVKKIKKTKGETVTRRLKMGRYESFRLQKRISHPKPKLKSAFRIFTNSLKLLIKNWKIFGQIILIYIVLDIILVKGLSSSSHLTEIKKSFQDLFAGTNAQITTGVTLFGLLLGSAGNTGSELSSAYQLMLLLIISLVVIWTLRQVLAGEKIGLSDTFYKSLYPLVPFLLVLIVVGIQLLPILVGGFLYNVVLAGGLAVTLLERILWGILLSLFGIFSLYMVCSSLFALYIVTLPDMRPLQALRSARGLVRYRRWLIMRKVVFLPIVLLIIGAIITIPIALFLTPIAEWVFFVLTILALPVIHSYMYSLYRELL